MDDKEVADFQTQITLKDGLGNTRMKKKAAVSRTHSYNIEKDRENYVHVHVHSILYYPWTVK